jgi:Tfp pilus assembly protein PilF
MSLINRALRDIDARRGSDAAASPDDALMRAYASARLPRDRAGGSPDATRSRRWPVLAAFAAFAGTAGAAIAFGMSDGGARPVASGPGPGTSSPATATVTVELVGESIAAGRAGGATTPTSPAGAASLASEPVAAEPVAIAPVGAGPGAAAPRASASAASSSAPPAPRAPSAVAAQASHAAPAAVVAALAPAPSTPSATTAPREPEATASIPVAPSAASIDVRPRPAGAEELQSAAAAALSAGDPDEAQRLLRAALALDPSLHTARQALLALLGRGERGAAWHAALEDAAAASPERFGLLAARGLADGGRIDAALVALARVPVPMRGVEYLTTAGLVAQRGGRHALAVENLAEALSRTPAEAPTAPALRVALAESLAAGGDAATARSHLAEVAEQPAARAELRALARRRLESLPR